ncbi:MAG TPA: sugar dehydrogenase complex small subunit [Acetobacteraceae bacterium]|nr:sugar dehydrogenase complex small subunit [Acetobacteraceae bacterium]
MGQKDNDPDDQGPLDRRGLLAGLLTAYTASLIPWASAQPVPDGDRGAFVAVSALLAGHQSMNEAQAVRLYNALAADDPGFPTAARALLAFINDRQVDPLHLQAVLDNEHSGLAALPRKIVTAWYLGVVGDGDRERCLAYETSLMSVAVADRLKPPTYAYGTYGTWASKPS